MYMHTLDRGTNVEVHLTAKPQLDSSMLMVLVLTSLQKNHEVSLLSCFGPQLQQAPVDSLHLSGIVPLLARLRFPREELH